MYVVEVFVDNEGQEGAQVTFLKEQSSEHIAISLFKSDTATQMNISPENARTIDRTIELLARSVGAEDLDEADALQGEAVDVIYAIAAPLDQEDEATEESSQPPSLHNLLFPKTSFYRLEEGPDGKLTVIPTPPDEAYGPTYNEAQDHCIPKVDDERYSSLPSYLAEQVQVVEQLVRGGGTVCLVQVNGDQMLCKARHSGLQDDNIRREVECLQKISFSGGVAAVPKLLGYIKHPTSGAILGFLREWVPSKDNLKDLKEAGFLHFPKETRQRIGRQIKETVKALHGIGVVWGDAKPSNVVVDLNQHAWLVDFGGGWSRGWVDEDLQDTVAGDWQAVARILEFLDVNASDAEMEMIGTHASGVSRLRHASG